MSNTHEIYGLLAKSPTAYMLTTNQWEVLLADEKCHFLSKTSSGAILGHSSETLVLFDRFIKEAEKVALSGRKHYSARTICEYLRHETEIHDNCPQFKINNNIIPILARTATELFPVLNGLFEFRGNKC